MDPAFYILWWTTLHLTLGCEPRVLLEEEFTQYQWKYTVQLVWDHGLETQLTVEDRFK